MIMDKNKPDDTIPAGTLVLSAALAGLTVLLSAGTLRAGDSDAEGISWLMLILGLTGGLAFFQKTKRYTIMSSECISTVIISRTENSRKVPDQRI